MPDNVVISLLVVCCLLDGIFILFTIRGIRRSLNSESWPDALGRIEEIERRIISEDNIGSIHIKYSYKVDGKTYESHMFSHKQVGIVSNISEDEFQKVLLKYPVGKDILVYYNPEDHAISVVERGYSGSLGLSLFCEVIVMLVLLALIYKISIHGIINNTSDRHFPTATYTNLNNTD